MSVIMKIYRSKVISEVLSSSSYEEVKSSIDATYSKLKEQNVSEYEIIKLIDEMLLELKSLIQYNLTYLQNANVISAKVLLKEHRLLLLEATH